MTFSVPPFWFGLDIAHAIGDFLMIIYHFFSTFVLFLCCLWSVILYMRLVKCLHVDDFLVQFLNSLCCRSPIIVAALQLSGNKILPVLRKNTMGKSPIINININIICVSFLSTWARRTSLSLAAFIMLLSLDLYSSFVIVSERVILVDKKVRDSKSLWIKINFLQIKQ